MNTQPVYKSSPIFSRLPSHPSVHASTIEALPDGDLLVCFYAGTVEKALDITIFQSRYSIQSGTWSSPEIALQDPDHSLGNPVLFLAPDGILYLYYLIMRGQKWNTCTLHTMQSTDSGRTWQSGADFEHSSGWTIRTNLITLANGDIIFPTCDESKGYSFFMASSDEAHSWEILGNVTSDPSNLQPAVVQQSNGDLLACIRTGGTGGHCWQSKSQDGGRTWSKATKGPFKNPNSALAMIKLASGNLAAVYNDSADRRFRTPLVISLSEDEGETWPYTRVLEDQPGEFTYSTGRDDNWDSIEFSYPALVQSTNGLIHVVYTNDSRHNIKHTLLNETWLME